MQSFDSNIADFFRVLQDEAHIPLAVSPIALLIDGERGPFEGHYAFHQAGAVRAEVYGNDIGGVSIWTAPGDLNHPDLYLYFTKVDVFAEVDTIANAMRGGGNSLMRDQGGGIFESVLPEGSSEQDVGEFMASIGPFAYDKKLSTVYDSYEVWASVNGRDPLSKAYFLTLAKNWLIRNGKGQYGNLEVKKATGKESTKVNSAQSDDFEDEVYRNQLYYKAIMLETALDRLAQGDELINSVFICGGPGDNRRYLVRNVLQKAEVWDTHVVWKSNSIKGIGNLMETLWLNRKDRILVLEGVDDLLKKNRGKARDLLLSIMDTAKKSRVVSYERIKRDDNAEQE